jgi:hypothetical protein
MDFVVARILPLPPPEGDKLGVDVLFPSQEKVFLKE